MAGFQRCPQAAASGLEPASLVTIGSSSTAGAHSSYIAPPPFYTPVAALPGPLNSLSGAAPSGSGQQQQVQQLHSTPPTPHSGMTLLPEQGAASSLVSTSRRLITTEQPNLAATASRPHPHPPAGPIRPQASVAELPLGNASPGVSQQQHQDQQPASDLWDAWNSFQQDSDDEEGMGVHEPSRAPERPAAREAPGPAVQQGGEEQGRFADAYWQEGILGLDDELLSALLAGEGPGQQMQMDHQESIIDDLLVDDQTMMHRGSKGGKRQRGNAQQQRDQQRQRREQQRLGAAAAAAAGGPPFGYPCAAAHHQAALEQHVAPAGDTGLSRAFQAVQLNSSMANRLADDAMNASGRSWGSATTAGGTRSHGMAAAGAKSCWAQLRNAVAVCWGRRRVTAHE